MPKQTLAGGNLITGQYLDIICPTVHASLVLFVTWSILECTSLQPPAMNRCSRLIIRFVYRHGVPRVASKVTLLHFENRMANQSAPPISV